MAKITTPDGVIISYDGKKIRFTADTGAGTNVMAVLATAAHISARLELGMVTHGFDGDARKGCTIDFQGGVAPPDPKELLKALEGLKNVPLVPIRLAAGYNTTRR